MQMLLMEMMLLIINIMSPRNKGVNAFTTASVREDGEDAEK